MAWVVLGLPRVEERTDDDIYDMILYYTIRYLPLYDSIPTMEHTIPHDTYDTYDTFDTIGYLPYDAIPYDMIPTIPRNHHTILRIRYQTPRYNNSNVCHDTPDT